MRYAEGRREETRARILAAAAARIRAAGPDGVSVAGIMRDVGLTHGGFYAHFRSKDDLVAAAITAMFDQSRTRLRDREETIAEFISRYVSARHRDRPEEGCPIAALSSDIHRQGAKVRAAFDEGVAGLARHVAAQLPQGAAAARRARALSIVSEMSGAVAAARAVGDPALSSAILASARASLLRRAQAPYQGSVL